MPSADPLLPLSAAEIALRLGLAALFGILLGFDREVGGHDAGIRTHALVALSSAIIMVASLSLFQQLAGVERSPPDPLRAIQGLSQAIGFIAAGLIFVRGGSVRNLTTAANVWLAAAIGIACGAGQYLLVVIGAVFGLMVLTVVKLIERRIPGKRHRDEKDRREDLS